MITGRASRRLVDEIAAHPSKDSFCWFCRRAHQNDIENILPFLTAGLLYVAINPNPVVALNLFRTVFAARVVHTLVYAFRPVPQPTRALAYFAAYGATFYMALQTVLFFYGK